MKTSVIRYRVADFLREHPPFDLFSQEDLLAFSGTGRVAFHEDDILLFEKGQARQSTLWVIQQGRIEMLDPAPQGDQLQDVLGPGDVLGLRRTPAETSYSLTARTATEAILYSFDLSTFEEYASRYPEAARFLTAHLSAATRHTKMLQAPAIRERLLSDREKACWLNAPPAAGLGRKAPHPAKGAVLAAAPGLSAAAYWLEMLRNRAPRLTLADPGGPDRLLTESDLAIETGRNPLLLLRQALSAETAEELAYLRGRMEAFVAEDLAGPSTVEWFAETARLWRNAILETAIRLATEAAGPAPQDAAACWLLFGPEARGESLSLHVEELGLVHASEPATAYFSSLAERVASILAAGGAEPPRIVRRSLPEWTAFYAGCIHQPIENAYYLTREAFDLRGVGGDLALASALQNAVRAEILADKAFLALLAHDTIANRPPLTFFQGVVLDQDGRENRSLDLGKTALTPIADAARVLAFAQGEFSTASTPQRLALATRALPQFQSTFADVAEGWRIASYHQARTDLARARGDASLPPPRLNRFEQRLLKVAFDATRRLLELTSSLHPLGDAQ